MKDILQYQTMVSSLIVNASVTHLQALCWLFWAFPTLPYVQDKGASQNG